MSLLLERLRRALSPQFTVERELAGGGMGIVFLGHDVTLDRPVAIKVLRPEQATAVGVERFLREARILARLRHPNIVPVFQGGEADGLLYHILEYQAGETLAQRLARGPLQGAELEALADGLMAALATAHRAGVVHRDIKPSNIFLVDGRAVVGDFGIAHTETGGETLTDAGAPVGTRSYMAPEQWRGGEPTPRTDLYSAALVLAESATGRSAAELAAGGRLALAGVPGPWAAPLRRALSEDPAARWADAERFRAALRGVPTRQRLLVRGTVGLVVVAVVAVVAVPLVRLMLDMLDQPPGPDARQFIVALPPFEATGGAEERALAVELHQRLLQGLTGSPDFVVSASPAEPGASASLRVSGWVRGRGEDLDVRLTLSRPGPGPDKWLSATVRRDLPADAVDSLAHKILFDIWSGDHRGELLPHEALPQSPPGFLLFLTAERGYARGAWEAALERYENVERIDPTCILCAYRIRDVLRWLNRAEDSLGLRKLVSQAHRFPATYRAVIEASALPPARRLDTLLAQREALRGFFDFHYLLGDELLHRGPLFGYPRAWAIEELQHARRLRPDFSGVTEHLVWVYVAEGDSARAGALLDTLKLQHPLLDLDEFTAGLRVMHLLGFAWRFQPEDRAGALTAQVLGDPRIFGSDDLAAGPRMMPAFGSPSGAVGFGRRLAAVPGRSEFRHAGLLAQALGWVALGRPDSAQAASRALAGASPEPSRQLFELALLAWQAVIGESVGVDGLPDRLREFRDRSNVSGMLDTQVDWWLAMLTGQELAESGPAAASPLITLARANALARRGDAAQALRLTAPISHEAFLDFDPFAGATARLLRARWMMAVGRARDAMDELRWHEHSHVAQIPRGALQAAEVDWAASSLALWRRAVIMAAAEPDSPELCRHWADVERRWRDGARPYAARADSARQARAAHPACRDTA